MRTTPRTPDSVHATETGTRRPGAPPRPVCAAGPDLSIVTVNYNTEDYLCACLQSVVANTHDTRFEHIVVDNASRTRGALDLVRREFRSAIVIENPRNLGFSGGCNVGIERAAGRYVLLLNPDTQVGPGALDDMVSFLDSRPDVAVLGSPLVHADGRDQRCAGRAFPTPLIFLFGRTTLLTRLFPNNRTSARFAWHHDPNRTEPYEVDWVSGACMMVRREAIDDVGPIDPGFFFMWEDADWCFRMHQAGWKVFCHHEVNVVHAEGGSRNRGWRSLWLSTLAFHKGAYRYYRKHINSRRFDPTHLLVMAGLAGRTLLLLVGRSAAKLARDRIAPSTGKRPTEPESRDLDSPVAR